MKVSEIIEACWKGYHKEGMKTMFGKKYPNCVKNKKKSNEDVAEDALAYMESLSRQLDEYKFTSLPYKGHKKEKKAPYALGSKHIGKVGGSGKSKGSISGMKAATSKDSNKPVVSTESAPLSWLNELDTDTLKSYRKKAGDEVNVIKQKQELGQLSNNDFFKKQDRLKGIGQATKRIVKRDITSVFEGKRIARKSGQPADSKKHSDLYTDENPKGTITGLKFATASDARASVTKIRSSGRSHAHKIQAAVAMEQRARAAGKSDAAAVYRAYINANKKTENFNLDEDLRKWFKQKWVRFGPDGKIRGDCARDSEKEGKPKCLPQSQAHALGKKGRASAAARKRREDPNANRKGKAINVATKK